MIHCGSGVGVLYDGISYTFLASVLPVPTEALYKLSFKNGNLSCMLKSDWGVGMNWVQETLKHS